MGFRRAHWAARLGRIYRVRKNKDLKRHLKEPPTFMGREQEVWKCGNETESNSQKGRRKPSESSTVEVNSTLQKGARLSRCYRE